MTQMLPEPANVDAPAPADERNTVGVSQGRLVLRRFLANKVAVVSGILFILLAIGTVVVVPVVLGLVGLGESVEWLISLARWPLMLLAVGLFLAVVYRYGPDRETAKWRWVSWGSGFAAILWVLGSIAFSWYVTNFGSYNETYGSLGAIIGFMTWIWISTMVVLVGAELDAEIEQQAEHGDAAPTDKGIAGVAA